MAAQTGIFVRSEWEALSLRELSICWDARQLDLWWHTACISQNIYNHSIISANGHAGKRLADPKHITAFHPFVVTETNLGSQVITRKNLSVLKGWAGARRQ